MASQLNIPSFIKGLDDSSVADSRAKYGSNDVPHSKTPWWGVLRDLLKEPMLILLVAVSGIYLIMQEYGEAIFMFVAIVAVSAISYYQDRRSRKALEALQKINEPMSRVIRNGEAQRIPTAEIVVGDALIVSEGETINADGTILHSNDFTVNESTLTGEAFSLFKTAHSQDNQVYSGTLVASGLAIIEVKQTGKRTKIGQLGESIRTIHEEPTPLQRQIQAFVKNMAIVGFVVFLLVWLVNFLQSGSWTDSLLKGLTLAMSILPEEIPVAFATFMALGSWRLMQSGIIVKRINTVETLGSATILCTDKTGTITENKMELEYVYAFSNRQLYTKESWKSAAPQEVIRYAMWSSEPVPFDPMEKTLHKVYSQTSTQDERRSFHIIHEYPLDGKPPMMTHLFEDASGNRIIAAKGAPEAILRASVLSDKDQELISEEIKVLANQGYRILGVARASHPGTDFPENQENFPFVFLGFVAFFDPPKKNIKEVFDGFEQAGIQLKIITGDNAITTRAIAHQAGLHSADHALDGAELLQMDSVEMHRRLNDTFLFTRMFPEAKLAVINAYKSQNETVAMVGDGVNDGPALKAAHIGIAMGKKGTEIAKQAAALIIEDDDLSKMLEAIAMGRKIYSNLKKAIQYIISIHIPIILTVALPLFLGWIYPNIFTPLHVIFLELIMGPTCSIVYENEPIEKNAMQRRPRPLTETFLSWKELSISVIQGLVITGGVLLIYQLSVAQGGDESTTRSMVFVTLIMANIFLTLENRSFYYSFIQEMRNRNTLLTGILLITLGLLALMLYVPFIATFFHLSPLPITSLLLCTGVAAGAVFWFELLKWRQRITSAR